jgi:hypothetical protein
VDATILQSLDKAELGRQEVIFELISTERQYVKDLKILRDVSALIWRLKFNCI